VSRTPTQSNVSGASKAKRLLLAGAMAAAAHLAVRRGWTLSTDVPRGHWACRTLRWTTGPGSCIAWIDRLRRLLTALDRPAAANASPE